MRPQNAAAAGRAATARKARQRENCAPRPAARRAPRPAAPAPRNGRRAIAHRLFQEDAHAGFDGRAAPRQNAGREAAGCAPRRAFPHAASPPTIHMPWERQTCRPAPAPCSEPDRTPQPAPHPPPTPDTWRASRQCSPRPPAPRGACRRAPCSTGMPLGSCSGVCCVASFICSSTCTRSSSSRRPRSRRQ